MSAVGTAGRHPFPANTGSPTISHSEFMRTLNIKVGKDVT